MTTHHRAFTTESCAALPPAQKTAGTQRASPTAPSLSRRAHRRKRAFLLSPYHQHIVRIICECWRIDARTLWHMVGHIGHARNSFRIEIKRLVAAGYIQEIPVSVAALSVFLSDTKGRPPLVYGPTQKGAVTVGEEMRRATTHRFLQHNLLNAHVRGVRDKACQLTPGFRVESWEFERALPPLQPAALDLPGPETYTADALATIEAAHTHAVFFDEIDLNTEPNRRTNQPQQSDLWKKLHFYLELHRRRAELLNTNNFRVCFYLPSLGHLRHFQTRITEAGRSPDSDTGIFWSTLYAHISFADPRTYLRSAIWYKGDQREPQPLFPPHLFP